jgi:hypothetical protein
VLTPPLRSFFLANLAALNESVIPFDCTEYRLRLEKALPVIVVNQAIPPIENYR